MMALEVDFKQTYADVLKEYFEAPTEETLLKAYELGKAFQENQIGPEELIGLHLETLDGLSELPHGMILQGFTVLMEAMMAYGLAHGDALRLIEQGAHQSEAARLSLEQLVSEIALKNELLEQTNLALKLSQQQSATLTAANDELHQLDTLRNQFIGIISHELRTPLNFMTGFTSLIADEVLGELNERQHAAMAKVLEGANRLETIIEELLDANKLKAGQLDVRPERVDYTAALHDVIASVQPSFALRELTLEAPTRPVPDLIADPTRLAQVLRNLLSNAAKFTPEGGHVSVKVNREQDRIVTRVTDTGIGIATDQLERIFKPFHQVDSSNTRAYGGTGLGLTIVRSLVEAMGGQVGVESEPGEGSIFWFTLPAADT